MRFIRALTLLTAMLAIVLIGLARWVDPDQAPSELLFVRGDIVTMADPPLVDAMWIEDGRIAALGSEQEVRAAAGPDVEVVDLAGTTLMPGLIEPHTHPLASAALGSAIDVSGFTHDSPEAVREALEEGVAGFAPQPWLIAFGWDPVMMTDLAADPVRASAALAVRRLRARRVHQNLASSVRSDARRTRSR